MQTIEFTSDSRKGRRAWLDQPALATSLSGPAALAAAPAPAASSMPALQQPGGGAGQLQPQHAGILLNPLPSHSSAPLQLRLPPGQALPAATAPLHVAPAPAGAPPPQRAPLLLAPKTEPAPLAAGPAPVFVAAPAPVIAPPPALPVAAPAPAPAPSFRVAAKVVTAANRLRDGASRSGHPVSQLLISTDAASDKNRKNHARFESKVRHCFEELARGQSPQTTPMLHGAGSRQA